MRSPSVLSSVQRKQRTPQHRKGDTPFPPRAELGPVAERRTQLPAQSDQLSMARTLLLLATFQLLPQLVLLSAPHPAPAFSIDPLKDEYLIGDTVALTCSAELLSVPVREFHFYSDTGFAVTDRVSSGRKKTYNFNITGPRDAGEYYCAYYTGRTGHLTKSMHSATITIKVKGPPAEPMLSVDPPSREAYKGHPIVVTCTAPTHATERRFHFYQQGAEIEAGAEKHITATDTPPRNVAVLSIPRADTNSTGKYSCGYEEKDSGRWIPSSRSQAVMLTLKGPPAEPTLSVDPPSREANEGQPLVITCIAPGDAAERRFHFYQQGAELEAGAEKHITAPETPPRNVAVLSIPRADTNSSGEYSCGYEEKDSGRWIPSSRSQAVMVTLKGPPAEPKLSVDPPSREANEGHPLVVTCTAPGHAAERRFHFYQHGAEIEAGSETHITEPDTEARNIAVLSIPLADTNSSGVYTCGYEEKDSGRWIPSTRSQAVMVTLKGEAAVGTHNEQ
ncbi:Fc receptor-like protein 5 isoform X2 [Pelodiscus sinensis]|uniref:Fc receptor-like protein 5 isoform X2 n=1 Tax=Pelodiscus sinensis TaxID=13735 RepID=UPI003F6B2721